MGTEHYRLVVSGLDHSFGVGEKYLVIKTILNAYDNDKILTFTTRALASALLYKNVLL